MSTGFNPYAPPKTGRAEPIAITDDELPADGRCELTPEDLVAASWARLGRDPYASALIAAVALAIGVAVPSPLLLLLGAFNAITTVANLLTPWLAGRAFAKKSPAERSARISLGHDALVLSDDTGEKHRVAWGSFARRYGTADRVVLETPAKLLFVLPRRAWSSPAEFTAVQVFVARRVPESKPSKRRWVGLAVFVFMVFLFVAVWSFFSDVPRAPAPAPSPAHSQSP